MADKFGAVPARKDLFAHRGELFDGSDEVKADDQQFIGFSVDSVEFLLPIAEVNEINRFVPIFPVPGSDRYIRGIFQLRGAVYPALDTATMLLGCCARRPPQNERLILVSYDNERFALIVDSTKFITDINPDDILKHPMDHSEAGAHFANKIVRLAGKMVAVLDVMKLYQAIRSEVV